MGLRVYWPLSVLCVFVCVCVSVCLCMFVRSNQSTSKKPHYVSDLSKVCTPPFCWRGLSLLPNFQCFSVTIKNLNWELKILTKNLVTFKRWDRVKDEKLWGFTEKSNL